jgi:DNA-binding GntR family transcriptional regulator
MADHANVEVTVREHENIMDALRNGDLGRGVEALRVNMQTSTEVLVRWIETRPPADADTEAG